MKCHNCGLHVEICNALNALQRICSRVTRGNFQVHLSVLTFGRFTGAAAQEKDPRP